LTGTYYPSPAQLRREKELASSNEKKGDCEVDMGMEGKAARIGRVKKSPFQRNRARKRRGSPAKGLSQRKGVKMTSKKKKKRSRDEGTVG